MNELFMKRHKDREGMVRPIISMDAEHLINYIRYMLIKLPEQQAAIFAHEQRKDFAPENMPEEQRKFLGLEKLEESDDKELQGRIEDIKADYLEEFFESRWIYLVIAFTRDDTREEVAKILQEVTGITGKVPLPNHTQYLYDPAVKMLTESDDPGDEFSDLIDPDDMFDPFDPWG